jgi:hypothetical protein
MIFMIAFRFGNSLRTARAFSQISEPGHSPSATRIFVLADLQISLMVEGCRRGLIGLTILQLLLPKKDIMASEAS